MPDLFIDNQPIIPVRLIPFVTGWKLSPDVVVEMLSKSDKWHRVFIPSFHLMPDNSYQPMLPKEWDVFDADLKILSDSLHARETVDGEHYSEWRLRSIEALPACTFVWLDDLKAAYERVNSRTIIQDKRIGDLDLNLQPYIDPKIRSITFEGFDSRIRQNNKVNYTLEENQTQGTTISFDELHHYMQLDPFYGNNSAAALSIINALYQENTSNDLFMRFDEEFSISPFKNQPVRHLIYIWCGLMGLPAYLNGKPTGWQREDFFNHWQEGFELSLSELKTFLRTNNWPLPVKLFPDDIDNTERKISMDSEKFEQAFNDFTVVLPRLKADLEELESIQPESMEARQQKKTEIEKIERNIASIYSDELASSDKPDNEPQIGSPEWRSKNAKKAADAKHNKPGGSRDKQRQMREAWASGKYTTKDRCAEEEWRL